MTCEVAVMNTRGVALAADSAVTLGESKKVYHTAEKLFCLSPTLPVAIMTYGSTDMMGAPWETIIKMYAHKLGERRFETLQGYASDFLSFIENSTALFPRKQEEYVQYLVWLVWSHYREQLEGRTQGRHMSLSQRKNILNEIIREHHEDFEEYDDFADLGVDYPEKVLETCADALKDAEKEVFEGFEIGSQVRRELRKTVTLMFGKRWIHPKESSGVVVAGMGEEQAFPSLQHFELGTIAAGKLRYIKWREATVGVDIDSSVIPFAQRETIDTITDGIHPELRWKLQDDVLELLSNGKASKAHRERAEQFNRAFEDYFKKHHEAPFMNAVSALPRQDLAKMAEALVSLTAFVMRMTADAEETVAEPIDVAVLSKGGGFTWVKHKDLVHQTGGLAL